MRSNNWHWYTDGIANVAVRDGDLIPDGFYRGRAFSSATRKKLSSSAIARGPNNKGVTLSDQARRNMSEAKKRFLTSHPDYVSPTQWVKGNVPWNLNKVYTQAELDHMRIARSTHLQQKDPESVCSSYEFRFYNKLRTVLDESDIVCQYTSEEYPYICDFYILSLNLYIECHYHWCHNDHPYDDTNPRDRDLVAQYTDYIRQGRSPDHYKMILDVWATLDVQKKEVAQKNYLNYVMLYKEEDEDALIRRIQSTICAD